MQRAAVSIMVNIAEGFERGGPGDFHRFLSIAKGSCAELRLHMYAAYAASYLTQERVQALIARADEVGRLIGGLRCSVQERR